MNQLLKYALDNGISLLVYTNEPSREVFKDYDQSKLVYIDEYDDPVENILWDKNDKRIVIYRIGDEIMWNKVYTIMEMTKKHCILVSEYGTRSKVTLARMFIPVFKAIIPL